MTGQLIESEVGLIKISENVGLVKPSKGQVGSVTLSEGELGLVKMSEEMGLVYLI